MKKLGFLFLLALTAQGAMASKGGAHYSNVAVVVAETGATLGWAPEYKEAKASTHQVDSLNKLTQNVSETMNLKLERRIADMIQVGFDPLAE